MREQDIFGKLLSEIDQLLVPKKETIPLDIKKTENGVELHFYVPGIKKEDIKLDVDQYRNFSIIVAPKIEKEDEWIYIESTVSGAKSRSMKLNPTLDTESISASLTDGVLVVSFSNKAKKDPIKVDIQIK